MPSFTNMMEGNSSDWTKQKIEKIVLWVEDRTNLQRTQKGSGETKKRWINAIASTISSRSEAQVYYKFDNLKKSYREALRLADQSRWGLDEDDLRTRSSLHGKSLTTHRICMLIIRINRKSGKEVSLFFPTRCHLG